MTLGLDPEACLDEVTVLCLDLAGLSLYRGHFTGAFDDLRGNE